MATELVDYQSMTLKEARDNVFSLINENPNSQQFKATNVDSHLNACGRRLFGLLHRASTEAWVDTEVGTPDYVVPAMFSPDGKLHVVNVQYAGKDLTGKTYDEDTTTSGTPTEYAAFNGELWLYPTPAEIGELRVEYMAQYLKPDGDTDTFPLTDELVDVCVLYAAYMMKMMDEEYTAAGMLKSQYESALDLATRTQTGVYKYQTNTPV